MNKTNNQRKASGLYFTAKTNLDKELALGVFLLHGVCFFPLMAFPDKGVWMLGTAAVLDHLPVAGGCTATSTGGEHKLNSVALTTLLMTGLH